MDTPTELKRVTSSSTPHSVSQTSKPVIEALRSHGIFARPLVRPPPLRLPLYPREPLLFRCKSTWKHVAVPELEYRNRLYLLRCHWYEVSLSVYPT